MRWLLEAVALGGYVLAAYLLNSWLMVLAPSALAILVLVWVHMRVRVEGE